MIDAPAKAAEREGALQAFRDAIGDVPTVEDPRIVRRRSRDFFWYSPVLQEVLKGKSADIVVTPRDEQDVVAIAAAAARHRVPVTPRGAGTGNYGQSVPLSAGVLLDMTGMAAIHSFEGGRLRAEPGAVMSHIDEATRPAGFELRMHPSTKRSATIGGFIAGGSSGVGSVTYGGLRDAGNILGARVVTVEETPRVLELGPDAAQVVNRAYGTTGIITRLDLPLAPAWPWVEVAVAFDDFLAAAAFGHEVALADGIVKKLLSVIAWPLPSFFGAFAAHCPEGKAMVLAMVSETSLATFEALLGARGKVTACRPSREDPGNVPLYEYTWNHTTLQVLKADRSVTYLQCLYPHDRLLSSVEEIAALFPGEVLPHLEFIRYGGHVTASALPVLRYGGRERLDAIIAMHEERGVMIANPHVITLEAGSRHKRANADQLAFKQMADPHGLLNPGKMESFVPAR